EDLLVDLGAIVREGCPAPVGIRGWFAVRVGHDHGVAVGVLVQYFGGPVEFFLGHVKAQVDGHKVQATGGEQVVVVLVVALAPRGVGGLGVLPSDGLFQGFVAVGVEVLVVQVVGTNIGARAVVVVAGQYPVHNFGVIQNLLGLRGEFEFVDGDLPVRVLIVPLGSGVPVFNDVAGVGYVFDLAFVRVVHDPFHNVRVRIRPDGLLFRRVLLLHRTLGQVLGVGDMCD